MSKDFIVPFGKYKGKELGEVDDLLYLDWMLGLPDIYPETRAALKNYLSEPVIERELNRLIAEKEIRTGG